MRIVFWNIQAGGGRRVEGIIRQLAAWSPTIIALAEFRGTPASQRLAAELRALGYIHQVSTVALETPATNALLLAATCPFEAIASSHIGFAPCRWLLATIKGQIPFTLGVMHIPNFVTKRKAPFYEAVLDLIDCWTWEKGMLIGDTNSGLPDIDEERPAFTKLEAGWMNAMHGREWVDGFRYLRGAERAYTWYSPNGRNGFRLDQAFINPALLPHIRAIAYEWGEERETPTGTRYWSDHAAVIVDLE
jgi:exonuclease III